MGRAALVHTIGETCKPQLAATGRSCSVDYDLILFFGPIVSGCKPSAGKRLQ
jgi:hypothetical protein